MDQYVEIRDGIEIQGRYSEKPVFTFCEGCDLWFHNMEPDTKKYCCRRCRKAVGNRRRKERQTNPTMYDGWYP